MVVPKFDGFRALFYTPLRVGDPVLLQTLRGALIQDRFPDLIAVAHFLPNGLDPDGELAVLDHHGQRSFTALQRRATVGRDARALAAEMPAQATTGRPRRSREIITRRGVAAAPCPEVGRRRCVTRLRHRFT
ncbi:hypothetical protein [Streptomyces sp. NPDC060322]|uniref:hypothetical protein n=1 Tax=Streptomyces sp. NPDC060322 TaxID=3347097 RepID=UPI0036461D12